MLLRLRIDSAIVLTTTGSLICQIEIIGATETKILHLLVRRLIVFNDLDQIFVKRFIASLWKG